MSNLVCLKTETRNSKPQSTEKGKKISKIVHSSLEFQGHFNRSKKLNSTSRFGFKIGQKLTPNIHTAAREHTFSRSNIINIYIFVG